MLAGFAGVGLSMLNAPLDSPATRSRQPDAEPPAMAGLVLGEGARESSDKERGTDTLPSGSRVGPAPSSLAEHTDEPGREEPAHLREPDPTPRTRPQGAKLGTSRRRPQHAESPPTTDLPCAKVRTDIRQAKIRGAWLALLQDTERHRECWGTDERLRLRIRALRALERYRVSHASCGIDDRHELRRRNDVRNDIGVKRERRRKCGPAPSPVLSPSEIKVRLRCHGGDLRGSGRSPGMV